MAETLVELTDSRSVLFRGGRELIRLDRQRLDLPRAVVEASRAELLARDTSGHPAFRFGYLLGIEDDRGFPAARSLTGLLARHLVGPVGGCRGAEFGLSFLKCVEGIAPGADEGPLFAGFHLDTHPEIVGEGGPELLRVLVNLAAEPRRLRFVRADRFELSAAGLDLPRSDFQVVEVPAGFEEATVGIPGADEGGVSYLTFWASLVPHVGVDGPEGHFLASFEALAQA